VLEDLTHNKLFIPILVQHRVRDWRVRVNVIFHCPLNQVDMKDRVNLAESRWELELNRHRGHYSFDDVWAKEPGTELGTGSVNGNVF
jgi:hypothetical protein